MGEQALYRTEQGIDYSDIFIQFQSQELLFMKEPFECLSPSFVFPGVQGMVHLLLLAVRVSPAS